MKERYSHQVRTQLTRGLVVVDFVCLYVATAMFYFCATSSRISFLGQHEDAGNKRVYFNQPRYKELTCTSPLGPLLNVTCA